MFLMNVVHRKNIVLEVYVSELAMTGAAAGAPAAGTAAADGQAAGTSAHAAPAPGTTGTGGAVPAAAVAAEGLRKVYKSRAGEVCALDGLGFSVAAGSV